MTRPPRKVMLVTHNLTAGGAERALTLLAHHWSAQGVDVTLVTFDNRPPFHPVPDGVRVRRMGLPELAGASLSTLSILARRVVRLRQIIREERPDAVVSFLTKVNVAAAAAMAGLDIPLVLSERNNPRRQSFSRFWRLLRSVGYRRADAICVLTEAGRDHMASGLRDRTHVIPNIIEMPRSSRRDDDRKGFVAAGRLVPQKGFDLLLRAYAQAAPTLPDWPLVIYGEGPEREALRALADDLGIADRVRLPGLSETPLGWVADGSVFVLSSRFEGFGNVLAEAMCEGLAPVAFDCDWGPATMIDHGENGLLVPAEDVSALAEALTRIANEDELREQFGRRARRVRDRFSPDTVVARWNELLAQVSQVRAA